MKSIHKPPTNYSCARCEEMSNARHNMNIHSISHGQELNIGCETCGYERKANVNIKKHRQSHDRILLTHVQNVSNKLKPLSNHKVATGCTTEGEGILGSVENQTASEEDGEFDILCSMYY